MEYKRRIDAIARNIERVQLEITRVAALRNADEPTVLAFPERTKRYLADLEQKLTDYKAELEFLRTGGMSEGS
jgi:hypothetical protein